MPARHPFLLPLPCAAGVIALLAGAAAQAQSISEASLQSTYGQLEALRKELVQQKELLQTQRQKQLQTPQLELVRKQVEQEGALLRDMAHNLREPVATRNAPQLPGPAGNPSLVIYLDAGKGNPQAQAQLSGASAPGGVGTIGISPLDLGSALTPLNGGNAAVITPGVISTGSLAPVVNGVQAMMNGFVNSGSSSNNGNASTSTSTVNPSSAVQDALQQSQQTAAVAAVQQSQQSQQSQQLSYDYVTAGLVTPVASWPTSLLATYNGNISGALGSGAAVSGTIQATVDFARINGAQPAISGNIAFDGGRGGTNFTMTKMGTVLVGTMTGTYSGQAVTGTLNSQFYGPSAEQLAGQWYFQNTSFSVSGIGNFQARR